MAEIRALIVDDEPLARRGIRQLLAPYRDIVVVGECRDGREALRALDTLDPRPDLVFLDVAMPGLDGLEVVRRHGAARMPAVVFVTAHDEFAVRAFEAQALDYLVKPLAEARFRATIARVRRRMRTDDALALAGRLSALLRGRDSEPRSDRVAIPTRGGASFVDMDEVEWIEAEDDHVGIHAGGKRHRTRRSLASFEGRLDPARFVRIHRTAIVRLDQVRELRTGGAGEARVILRNGTELPVSRRRLARVKELLAAAAHRLPQ